MIKKENKYQDYPMITEFSLDGIDPVRMIKKKGSYLKFVADMEDNHDIDKLLSDNEKI